ncbi:proline racemase family protein [Synergistaceae bacterium OttesenSCG-928-I11]|nr:proline racemase family protein [Synergistaceae bacterium OttesenSCG-928-I11]
MISYKKMIWTADTHTAGQPTRTVFAGMPRLRGCDMSEKMLFMKEHYDYIRTFLISEPRGRSNTSLAILTEPTLDEADVGVFFCESHGYMPMCGHNTIGVATMLVETGMVEVMEPVTEVKIETPAGLVSAKVNVVGGRVESVTFVNAPAIVIARDLEVEFRGRTILADVTYGGNIYGVVSAEDLGLAVEEENVEEVIAAGMEIYNSINSRYDLTHPEKTYLKGVGLVQITAPLSRADKGLDSKSAVIYPPGEVDRSPCGTGTSGRLALLYDKGLIGPGEVLKHRSIINTQFSAKIIDVIDYYDRKAIIPEVTGSAYMTGFNTFTYDPHDPRGGGFILRK